MAAPIPQIEREGDGASVPKAPGGPAVAIDPRILQANERTLLAWVRTSVGVMAFGFVVARLGLWLRHLEGATPADVSVSAIVGTATIAFGAIMSAIAALRFRRFRRSLLRGEIPASSVSLETTLAFGIAAVGLVLSAYLLLR